MQTSQTKRLATLADFRLAAKTGKEVRGFIFRAAEVGTIDVEKRTVGLAFSSETPVDRGYLIEILDHSNGSVDMDWVASGRAPLLADHDPTMQIGVIESAQIGKDRIARAVARFGKSAQADAYFQDVVDGIRTNISVGYDIQHVVLEEETDVAATYRAMKWKPLEISLVSIPADKTVGIGRSGNGGGDDPTPSQPNQPTEKRTMTNEPNTPTPDAPRTAPAITVDADKIRADARQQEADRVREIYALGSKHGFQTKADEFIGNGKTANEFRTFVLENMGAAKPVETAANDATIGLTEKEARNFSVLRAMRAQVFTDNKRAWEDAAFEREVADAVQDKFKHRKFRGNIQIPVEVLTSGQRNFQKRDLNVGNAAQGGYLVADELQPASFIELLRNRLLVRQLGARVLTGLEGNMSIPKQTGGATAYWLNEGDDATESQQAVGQVAMTPKTVGAYTEFTRRMLLQSSLDVENFVRDDLAKTLATEIDRAALNGSGSGGEPLGILNTTGIGSVTITTQTFTFGKMVDLESAVATDNADLGSLAYLANAADRGRMKQTEKASSTGQFIWGNMAGQPGVGEVNGYPAYATNQLADDAVIFGNWEDLLIGEWGVLDILVNPYAKDTNGGVRVTSFQDVDVVVRHAESFAATGT